MVRNCDYWLISLRIKAEVINEIYTVQDIENTRGRAEQQPPPQPQTSDEAGPENKKYDFRQTNIPKISIDW